MSKSPVSVGDQGRYAQNERIVNHLASPLSSRLSIFLPPAAGIDHRLDGNRHARPQLRFSFSTKFGTCGSSCIVRPTPWPTNSRTTLNPFSRHKFCTAREISTTRLPGTACAIPQIQRLFRHIHQPLRRTPQPPTATVRAVSPINPL
jgi:hypothetical protein